MATFDDVRRQNRSRTHVPPCGRMGFWWDRRYGLHASYGLDLVHALTGVENSSMEKSDIEWLFHATVFSVFDAHDDVVERQDVIHNEIRELEASPWLRGIPAEDESTDEC